MKIKLAFYKGESGFIGKVIRWWTKSPYSHVEMVIKDKWISSDIGAGGVTIRDLKPLKDNWDYIDVDVDGRKIPSVMKWIEEHKDDEYDTYGVIFSQLFSISVDDRNKLFCSEMVTNILQIFGENKVKDVNPVDIDPGELFEIYSK